MTETVKNRIIDLRPVIATTNLSITPPILSNPSTRTDLCRMRTESLAAPSRPPGNGFQTPETEGPKPPTGGLHSPQRPHGRYFNCGNAREWRAVRQRPGNVGSHWTAWWWMQPTSNQSPHPNSLLTAKLTAYFADWGPPRRFSRPIDRLIQWLAAKFPTQQNSEFFSRSSESVLRNSEFSVLNR